MDYQGVFSSNQNTTLLVRKQNTKLLLALIKKLYIT